MKVLWSVVWNYLYTHLLYADSILTHSPTEVVGQLLVFLAAELLHTLRVERPIPHQNHCRHRYKTEWDKEMKYALFCTNTE